MNDAWAIDLVKISLQTLLMVAGPLLAVALVVGLLVSIFQALTQINESTLSFIPKILAIGGAILIFGPWMIRIMTSFTQNLYENMNTYLR
ncbi:MAG: flagellar biosynthesis protein FliQ [Bdellovibrionales bacterium]|nr:flagellar biosynthesis protein FliQ [Bdellovibrionales bacterium]